MACSDPLLTCSPCRNWSDVKSNGGNAPTHFSYRWYQSETDEVPDGCSGASIIGTCHLSNFGDMSECAAYRHVGMNMSELMCIGRSLRLEGSPWQGSIRYSMLAKGGGWSDAAADGEPVGEGGRSLRWSAIKVWLTGDVSLHFDLEVRAFNSNVGWTAGYVSGTELDAPTVDVVGDLTASNDLRCVQVDLIPKPEGAVVLRDFSRDGGTLNITEDEFADMQDRYLSCVVMQAFPTELRKGPTMTHRSFTGSMDS